MLKYSERINITNKAIVPQWKYCQYNQKMLDEYLQKIQQIATNYRESAQLQTSLRFNNSLAKDDIPKKLAYIMSFHYLLKNVSVEFQLIQDKEMEVIQRFAKLKFLELKTKFQYYQAAFYYTPENDEDSLTLLENLYIEGTFLEKLIKHSLQAEDRILREYQKTTQQIQQIDVPFPHNARIVQRVFKNLLKLKGDIQIAYLQKRNPVFTIKDKEEFRKSALNEQQEDSKFFSFGLFCGVCFFLFACLMTLISVRNLNFLSSEQLVQLFKQNPELYNLEVMYLQHFPIWRGLGSIIFFIWVIGICSIIFHQYQINYQRILTLQRHVIASATSILVFAGFCSIVYFFLFCIYVYQLKGQPWPFTSYIPGLAWLITIFLLFFPVHSETFNNYFRGRYYIQLMVVRMLISWIIGVEFASNWLSQNLSSFKQPFQDLIYSLFYYLQTDMKIDNEDKALYFGAWMGTSIFILRILQSLRNGITHGPTTSAKEWCKFYIKTSPFARGAFKCILNIGTIWSSYSYRKASQDNKDNALAIWIMIGTVSTLYAFSFDIFFDWNLCFLFKKVQGQYGEKEQCLSMRQHRVFKFWVYPTSSIINLFFRFLWTLSLSTDFVTAFLESGDKYWVIFFISMIQFCRRGVWNIFMIQKQHIRNTLQFQAIVSYQSIENRINSRFSKADKESYEKSFKKYKKIMFQLKNDSKEKQLFSQFSKLTQAVDETKQNYKKSKRSLETCTIRIQEMERIFNIRKKKS